MIIIENIYMPFYPGNGFFHIYQNADFFKENKPNLLVPSKKVYRTIEPSQPSLNFLWFCLACPLFLDNLPDYTHLIKHETMLAHHQRR